MAVNYAPGPKGQLVIGNLPDMQHDPLSFLTGLSRQYGDFSHFKLGPFHVHLVTDPETIHNILVEQSDLFPRGRYSRDLLSKAVGLSLLTSDGLYHRQQRRLAQPAFHHKRVQSYGESMVRITRQIMDTWQPGKVIDVDQQMLKITLYIVAKTLFDTDMSDDTASAIGDSITSTQEFVNAQFRTMFAPPEWVPTRLNRDFKQAKDTLRRIIMGLIERHRASGQDNGDLLSMLMLAIDEDNGQHMTDEQLLVESLGIIAAGHETTANALNFTWYLLSQNPDIEAKLHEELDRVLGGRAPTLEDLGKLPYTNMVIKESMRLYPPAWAINRQPTEDITINDHTIRKGEMIILSPYVLGRDPRYFDDPECFKPERWADGLEKRLPRFVYMPFAGGPHICIGQQFAVMEANLLLATMAQRYRFELQPEHEFGLDVFITLRPRGGLPMRVVAR